MDRNSLMKISSCCIKSRTRIAKPLGSGSSHQNQSLHPRRSELLLSVLVTGVDTKAVTVLHEQLQEVKDIDEQRSAQQQGALLD